jgi:hypothetical protein
MCPGVATSRGQDKLTVRREAEEDRRKAQARLISAWLSAPEEDLPPEFTLMVRNRSNEPIYQVKVTMVPYNSPFGSDPEAGAGRKGTVVENLGILPPSEDWRKYFDPRSRTMPGPVGISFTDAAGHRWKRLPNGTLTETTRRRRRSRKDYMNAWIAGELDHLHY